MIGEAHIREALDINECPMCRDGWPVFQGLHELPEPAGMFRCSKTQKDPDPMTNTAPVTEQELKAQAVAPRVTNEDVEAFIAEEQYFTAANGVVGSWTQGPKIPTPYSSQLELLTICVLVLANGFTVHGTSACADKANFDPEIGRRLARANAKNHIWAHLGFELRTKLDMIEKATPPSQHYMGTYVGTKVIHALPMTRGNYNKLRGWITPADEDGFDDGYLVEYADGGDANVDGFAGYVSWSPQAVFDRAYGNPLR